MQIEPTSLLMTDMHGKGHYRCVSFVSSTEKTLPHQGFTQPFVVKDNGWLDALYFIFPKR